MSCSTYKFIYDSYRAELYRAEIFCVEPDHILSFDFIIASVGVKTQTKLDWVQHVLDLSIAIGLSVTRWFERKREYECHCWRLPTNNSVCLVVFVRKSNLLTK